MFENLWRRARMWWDGPYEQNLEYQLKIAGDEIVDSEREAAVRGLTTWVRKECDRCYREGFLAGRASTRGQS